MPRVLSSTLLDNLRHFAPDRLCDVNLWMKYSLQRYGASVSMLLRNTCGLNVVLLAIEKLQDVFWLLYKHSIEKYKADRVVWKIENRVGTNLGGSNVIESKCVCSSVHFFM